MTEQTPTDPVDDRYRRTNLTMLEGFYRRAVAEIEWSRVTLEANCLHGYEHDQHYRHDGDHELPTWREIVALRARVAQLTAENAEMMVRHDTLQHLADVGHRDKVAALEAEIAELQLVNVRLIAAIEPHLRRP